MKNTTNRRFILLTAAISLGVLPALGGCASTAQDDAPVSQPAVSDTLENCGFTLTTAPAPERVVTIKSTPLELMLALGLSDRVVGSAMLDGPVPDALAPSGWEAPVISDELPSQEVLLAAEPDFVFAGWASNLESDGVGTREDLLGFDIRSYIAPPACDFGSDASSALEFDDVFQMVSEVGGIFGVEDRADSLIAEQRARLDAVEASGSGPSALWFSSGGDTPFVGGGTGAPNMIMAAAGLRNAAASEPQSWFSMAWEAFVDADPDVIVLVDAPWNSAAQKRELLEQHPAARTMRAVRDERFIVVDFATTEAGVRNVEAVETIAQALDTER